MFRQLAVAQVAGRVFDRDPRGIFLCPVEECGGDGAAELPRQGGLRIGQSGARVGREQGQFEQPPCGGRRHLFEQEGVLRQQLFHPGTIEKIGVVDQLQRVVVTFEDVEVEIDLGFEAILPARPDFETRPAEAEIGQVGQVEHHLEKGRCGRIAFGIELLQQPFEGHGLVFVGLDHAVADFFEEIREGLLGVQLTADDQGVEEQTDEGFQLALGPGGDRNADEDVVLTSQPVHQHLITRHQDREKGCTAAGREVFEAAHQRAGQPGTYDAAGAVFAREARAVGGQGEQRLGIGQAMAPIGDLVFLAGRFGPLPGGVVAVLQAGCRQPGRFAGGRGEQANPELPEEDAGRPAIKNDVVEAETEPPGILAEVQEAYPEQQGVGEIERLHQLGEERFGLFFLFFVRQPAQIEGEGRQGQLPHFLIGHTAVGAKRGPQRFVAFEDFRQRLLEVVHFELTGKVENKRHVVGRAAELEQIEQPHPFLGEGQRQTATTDLWREGRNTVRGMGNVLWTAAGFDLGKAPATRFIVLEALAQGGGEIGQARFVEKEAQRHLGSQPFGKLRTQPASDQRVAAKVEEVVVAADLAEAEGFRPDVGNSLFEGTLRGCSEVLHLEPDRRGQGAAVDLAVGGQRQAGKPDEIRRQHEFGQTCAQARQELVLRLRLGTTGVGDQPLVSRLVFAQQDQRFFDPRQARKRGLDFGGFDAETAQLDLMIGAADKIQLLAGQLAYQVAGQIKAGARPAGEGVGHKTFGGLTWFSEVTESQGFAADGELAESTGRHRYEITAEHPNVGGGNRPTDRHRKGRGGKFFDLPGGRDARGFGRPITVDQPRAGLSVQRLAQQFGVAAFTAEKNHPQGVEKLRAGADVVVEQRRGEEADANPVLAERCRQRWPGEHLFRVANDETGTVQQCAPDLEESGIEGDIRAVGEHLAVADFKITVVADQADDALLGHHHPFGAASRAGGEKNHRGDCCCQARRQWMEVPFGLACRLLGVENEEAQLAARKGFAQRAVSDDQREGQVLEHGLPAFRRVGRVERGVGGTHPGSGENGDDVVDGPFQADGQDRAGTNAGGHQSKSQPFGGRIELAIGEAAFSFDQGEFVALQPRLLAEKFVESEVERGMQLGGRQKRDFGGGIEAGSQLGERPAGFPEGQPQKLGHGSQQVLHPFRGVEVRVEVAAEQDGPLLRDGGQGEVETGRFQLGSERRHKKTRKVDLLALLSGLEKDLNQRVAGRVAFGAQLEGELVERHELVVERAAKAETGAAHQFEQCGLTRQRGTQHQGIDEETDDFFGVEVLAAGRNRADGNVAPVGETAEDLLENGRQHDEEGFAAFLEEIPECRRKFGVELEADGAAAFGEDRRPSFFARQLEGLELLQLAAPIIEKALVTFTIQAFGEPGCVVAVTQPGHRQGRLKTAAESAVKRRQLPQQEVHRPAIAGNVVHGEQEDEGFVFELNQRGAVDRPGRQIEGVALLLPFELLQRGQPLRRRKRAQVDVATRSRQLVGDHKLFETGVRIMGPQDFVTQHQGLEGAQEGGELERAAQFDSQRHVVGRRIGRDLLQEKHAPLARRQHLVRARLGSFEGRQTRGARHDLQLQQAAGELAEGGETEKIAQRQVDRPAFAHPGDQFGGQQRMPTELEEVFVHARQRFEPEHPFDQRRELTFERCGRWPALLGIAFGRGRQGLDIDLVAAGAGQSRQQQEGGRHLVFRQAFARPLAQGRHLERFLARQVGDQNGLAVPTGTGHHDHFPHPRHAADHGFDFARLDAEAADLELGVDTAEEFDVARGQPAHQVAAAVEPGSRLAGEGIGHKFFGGGRGPPQIAAGDVFAADQKLAGRARRQGLAFRIDHVKAGEAVRFADRRPAFPRRFVRPHVVVGHFDGGFGRAVEVENPGIRQLAPQGHQERQRNGFSTHGERARCPTRHLVVFEPAQQLAEERHRHIADADAVGGDPGEVEGGIAFGGVGHHKKGAATTEGAPHFGHRNIENRAAGPGAVPAGGDRQRVAQLVEQRDHAAVVRAHPFGLTGRAGGENGVGELFARQDAPFVGPFHFGEIELERQEGRCRRDRGRLGGEDRFAGKGFKDVFLPGRRQVEGHRHVITAGAQNGQLRHHAQEGAIGQDRHRVFGADAERRKVRGHFPRRPFELAVGQAGCFVGERQGVRLFFGPGQESRRNGECPLCERRFFQLVIAVVEQFLAPGLTEQVEAGKRQLRSGRNGPQQLAQRVGPALRGSGQEKVGVVLNAE